MFCKSNLFVTRLAQLPSPLSLMASLSSLNRFFFPKLPIPSFKKPFLTSTISFQPLPKPQLSSSSYTLNPIKSESQPRTETQVTPLPPNLKRIVNLFQSVSDPKSKYQQLLHYGTQLPPYPPQFKTDPYRVRGCVSQVWIRAYPDPNDSSKIRFDADSDSSLTKGLAALLVLGLSGEAPGAVASVSPDFVQLLGLRQSLTPSRNNGFLNMLKLMQEKAAEVGGLSLVKQDEILTAETRSLDGDIGGFERRLEMEEEVSESVVLKEETEIEMGNVSGGRKERIRERLDKELKPVELEVEDVSHMHAGHAGVRGNIGGETHFNLKMVSEEFEGKSMLKRHRLVYDLLREELDGGLHALSIVAKTPAEV